MHLASAVGASDVIQIAVEHLAALLLGSALIGMLVRRFIRVPYVVALVLAGLAGTTSHLVKGPQLDPNLMLFAFLPPLLFDASFRLDAGELRNLFRPVALLAGPGVVLTAVIVALAAHFIIGLSIPVGLLLGSLVAATDPVAVTAVFEQLRVPKHAALIVESESLVNDGVALTLFVAFLTFVVEGVAKPLAIADFFLLEVVGGIAIGSVLGIVGSNLTKWIDDHLIEMTLSAALAYGSYLMADVVGASGPLACVAAGLIHGSYGRRIGMSEQTRELLDDLWEFLGFLANSVVFLLIGFSIDLVRLSTHLWPLLVIVVAVLVARGIMMALVPYVMSQGVLTLSRAEQIVLAWGGLRGGLTIAMALSLPAITPSRDLLIDVAFGVALFTLVVQGISLPAVIRLVGLAGPDLTPVTAE